MKKNKKNKQHIPAFNYNLILVERNITYVYLFGLAYTNYIIPKHVRLSFFFCLFFLKIIILFY